MMVHKKHIHFTHPNSTNRGAVLIVSLVMLTIITVIAIGTTSDIGLQANMTKNSQISLRAFNSSLGQLNTLYNELEKDGSYQNTLSDLLLTNTPITDNIPATYSKPFVVDTSISQVSSDADDSVGGANIHGNSLGNSMSAAIYTFEINSVSSLPNITGLSSDQTFKVIYTKPPSS